MDWESFFAEKGKFHSLRQKEEWLWEKRSYDFIMEDIILAERLFNMRRGR